MKKILDREVYSDISYNNIPQSELKTFNYRDINSSDTYNENQKNIINDLLDLYNKANTIESIIKETKKILDYETSHSNFKIKRLEQELDNIKNVYESLINVNGLHKINVYPNSSLKESTTVSDEIFNCITVLPSYFETKTYIINEVDNTTYMPTDISNKFKYININEELSIVDTKSNNVLNVFDGDSSTYWYVETITDSSIKELNTYIEFEIPDNIITSREVNELFIRPYPANSIDILDVEYKTTTGSYEQIPSYHDYCLSQSDFNVKWNLSREEFELIDVDSVKFNFKPVEIHKVKVTVRQTHYTVNNDGTNTFVWGFKTIDPRMNTYSNLYQKVCFTVDFPINKRIILDSVKPIFTNEKQIDTSKVRFDYYNFYEDGSKVKILNTTPFVCDSNSLYIECNVKAYDCSPNILKFEVRYKYDM